MAKRLGQVALVGVVLLVVAAMAAAQQVPQPVVRLGNWLEIGNDVFIHNFDIRLSGNIAIPGDAY